MSKRARVAAASAVTVALAVAGIGFGAIPAANGVISACYDKQSGHLRIYDAEGGTPKGCGSTETSISWNQQGPRGDKGETGPQGPPGPAGTSQGYSAHVDSVPLTGTTTVISKTLPAGKYLLFASVELFSLDLDSSTAARCSMPGYETTTFGLSPSIEELGGYRESVSMASAISHPGGDVIVSCTEVVANLQVSGATLNAIKVDSIG